MKTKLPSRFVSRFLFYGLGFMALLGNAKSVLAGDTRGGWGAENPTTGGLPIDVQACATDTALRFMIGPLILVGIVIYLVVYLFKYGKDSPEKKERMILWGGGMLCTGGNRFRSFDGLFVSG